MLQAAENYRRFVMFLTRYLLKMDAKFAGPGRSAGSAVRGSLSSFPASPQEAPQLSPTIGFWLPQNRVQATRSVYNQKQYFKGKQKVNMRCKQVMQNVTHPLSTSPCALFYSCTFDTPLLSAEVDQKYPQERHNRGYEVESTVLLELVFPNAFSRRQECRSLIKFAKRIPPSGSAP